MIISLMAAMSEDRVLGREGKLPWHSPADLARFKSITMGNSVLMGRKTFDSIGRPLPGRRNIVLSRSRREIEGCQVARSLQEGIAAAEGNEEIFIIGGGEVFREALPLCQRIYLTTVHGRYQGDVYFPQIPDGFVEVHREELPEVDPPITFVVFEKVDRIQPGGDVQELRRKGREAMQRQLYFLGRRCFEQALALEENAEDASLLALCMLKSGGERQAALKLAEKAIESEPENTRLYLTVGRVQVMAGAKERGLATLRKGVQLGAGQELLAELEKCGNRLPPPIKSLSRSHPLNRYLGLVMHRMGLR